MAGIYVANYGNVENDGLSWETPKRSIQSAFDTSFNPVYAKGFYREALNGYRSLIAVGKLVIDGTLLNNGFINSSNGNLISGVTIQNFIAIQVAGSVRIKLDNCIIRNFVDFNFVENSTTRGIFNCLIVNCNKVTLPYGSIFHNNNVIYNTDLSLFLSSSIPESLDTIYNIISECNVAIGKNPVQIKYSLFHNCTFKFTGGGIGSDETEYSIPNGANDAEKLANLRSRLAAVYGGSASQYLIGCKYQTDGDLFINPDKENFYLVPGCTASRMSYEGGCIGKYPEGSLADFATDFASYSNIDANGDIIDQTVNATAETNISDLGKLRHISSLKALGERAIRNGNEININANLGAEVDPGTLLIDGATYIVRTEAISLTASGKSRDVGETFIASATDGLEFTSDTGYVQQYIFDLDRTIEMKVSKTDSVLSTAVWIKLKLDEMPMVNYDANGVVQYGNADDNYDEASAERMYIRYWKAKITVQAKNLPA
ncbi:hypothetical protein [Plebeiibacterium sediminum]|uniref:Right-handed parallel beta-helix repeat-containing protein n=1 Tax=Plebeiibacterium sediminum TaxID=2992112 RepID=A0AAE3M0T0_9BACT|nr:hypothetical protein [Plebeiobacterium sediminum]MCW3784939.1 right-handed parallel beta-helix repeat-containing protein [Plebeiobacterium sediminum]